MTLLDRIMGLKWVRCWYGALITGGKRRAPLLRSAIGEVGVR